MSAEQTDYISIVVPKGAKISLYWSENPQRNLFWLQNAQKFDELFQVELKLFGDQTQHTLAAEATREQISKTLMEVHNIELQKLKQTYEDQLSKQNVHHVEEIRRLQSAFDGKDDKQQLIAMLDHQNELNRKHIAEINANNSKELLTQIDMMKTIDASKSQQITRLEEENKHQKAEIDNLKSKIPKKHLTVAKTGGIAEDEAVECIASIVPSYVKDISNHKKHTATTHGDRHILTKSSETNPANMLLEVKSGFDNIHIDEIERFNRNIRQDSEGYINSGFFLSLKVKIPYKPDAVTWEIIEREGKPPIPVIWVHSDDEITIKSAAVSLVQMQALCTKIFESRKKSNAGEAILAYQNDMEKIRLGFPSIVAFFKSREDVLIKRIDTLQGMIDDIQNERAEVQDMYEKVDNIIKNVQFLREMPIPDSAMEAFERILKTKREKDPDFQASMIKINDFSGNARSLIQKAGINNLKERYKANSPVKPLEETIDASKDKRESSTKIQPAPKKQKK